MKERYYKFSTYLNDLYGQKVYKIPVNVEGTCPNRDHSKGKGGCTFCSLKALAKDMIEEQKSVREQVEINKQYIGNKYKAKKFIIYFQNYTSTYLEEELLERKIISSIDSDVVEVCLSTRPDCISDSYIDMLARIRENYKVNITVELGLQSVNDRTLEFINRQHTVSDYVDAVIRLKKRNFIVGTHLIVNLPGDDFDDFVKSAYLLNELGVDRVKLHSLFISKDTVMGEQYLRGDFEIISIEEYISRVVEFVKRLNPDITIERFFSRSDSSDVVFCNWSRSWRYLKNKLDSVLDDMDVTQGDLYE